MKQTLRITFYISDTTYKHLQKVTSCCIAMLKSAVFMIALIAGFTASEFCDESFHQVCSNDNTPKEFPATAEELQDFCSFAIDFFECGVKYAKRCDNDDVLEISSNHKRIFQDICNKDTLLYAAVESNLPCFHGAIINGGAEECQALFRSTSDETLQKHVEALTEEGLLSVSNDEDPLDRDRRMFCLKMLQELACYGTKLEDKCGVLAVDTYLEITQKFAPIALCGETYHYLPTIVRIHKLEKEEAREIEENIEKRK